MDGSSAPIFGNDATANAPVSRDVVRKAMAAHLQTSTKIGLLTLAMDLGMYVAAIAGVLFLEPLWAKILCSVLAGVKIANLGTLGHDAAHGNLVSSPALNHVLGALCFMPGLFNYRLWLYDHHHVHHPFTNGDHEDSWKPFTKAQFDALPPMRRALERLYRSSYGMGLAPYYLLQRWTQVKFIPRSFLPQRFRASAWAHFALLIAYLGGFIGLLAAAPLYSNTSAVTAVVLGWAVPFYIWMTFFSFTVYVQHTHARIPWFEGPVDRRTAIPQEVISLHLDFPAPVKKLMHNIYEHAAHHTNVRIPFHRLAHAQAELNRLSGDAAVVQKFSFKWLHETLRDCRLYDYETNRWCDFNGRPTGPVTLTSDQHAAMERHGPGTQFVRQA